MNCPPLSTHTKLRSSSVVSTSQNSSAYPLSKGTSLNAFFYSTTKIISLEMFPKPCCKDSVRSNEITEQKSCRSFASLSAPASAMTARRKVVTILTRRLAWTTVSCMCYFHLMFHRRIRSNRASGFIKSSQGRA